MPTIQVLAICLNRPAPAPTRPASTGLRRTRGMGGFGAARSLKTEAVAAAVIGTKSQVSIEQKTGYDIYNMYL